MLGKDSLLHTASGFGSPDIEQFPKVKIPFMNEPNVLRGGFAGP